MLYMHHCSLLSWHRLALPVGPFGGWKFYTTWGWKVVLKICMGKSVSDQQCCCMGMEVVFLMGEGRGGGIAGKGGKEHWRAIKEVNVSFGVGMKQEQGALNWVFCVVKWPHLVRWKLWSLHLLTSCKAWCSFGRQLYWKVQQGEWNGHLYRQVGQSSCWACRCHTTFKNLANRVLCVCVCLSHLSCYLSCLGGWFLVPWGN